MRKGNHSTVIGVLAIGLAAGFLAGKHAGPVQTASETEAAEARLQACEDIVADKEYDIEHLRLLLNDHKMVLGWELIDWDRWDAAAARAAELTGEMRWNRRDGR